MARTETRTELLNRAFIYIIVIGFGVLIILQVSPLLFDLFVSLVLASIAEPLVIRIESYIGRPFSAFISVLLVLLIITLTLLSIIPIMVSQFYELTTQLPVYFDSMIQIVENNQLINFDINSQTWDLEMQSKEFLKQYGATVGNTVAFAGQTILKTLSHTLIIFILTFFLISDGPKWRISVKKALPSKYSKLFDDLWTVGVSKAGGFIAAKFILSVLAGIVISICFALIGLPSPIALGFAAGILSQLIPFLGTFIGGVVPVLAALSLGTNALLFTLLVLLAYQFVEGYIFTPIVAKKTLSIHPGVAIFATLFGGYVIGITGVILALPVAATIHGFVTIILNKRVK